MAQGLLSFVCFQVLLSDLRLSELCNVFRHARFSSIHRAWDHTTVYLSLCTVPDVKHFAAMVTLSVACCQHVVDLSGVQERPDEFCSGSDQQVNLLSPVLTGKNLRSPHLPRHLSHVSCSRILDDCHQCHKVHISPALPRV